MARASRYESVYSLMLILRPSSAMADTQTWHMLLYSRKKRFSFERLAARPSLHRQPEEMKATRTWPGTDKGSGTVKSC